MLRTWSEKAISPVNFTTKKLVEWVNSFEEHLPYIEQIENSGEVFSGKDDCVVTLKRNTYHPPNQFRVQRRRCHIHYAQIILLQC